MKIAFVTDSGAGKSMEQQKEDGIFSLPLQIGEGESNYRDLETITLPGVFKLLHEGKVMTTSLPSQGEIEDLFAELKADGYEMIFAVPICVGLSGTMNAMRLSALEVDIPFESVDCHVTAMVQDYLIHYAKDLHEQGASIVEIKEACQKVIDTTSTLILADDLQHLKRGGRLTPIAATLAGILRIKPILKIDQETSGRIDVYAKIRTKTKAVTSMLDVLRENIPDEGEGYSITVTHVDAEEDAIEIADRIREIFPKAKIDMIPLVSVVSIHTGIGCIALQYFKMNA